MEDDVQFGHVVDLTLGEPAGTELVANAAIGATSLSVDYAGDFEDAGDLTLNGVTLAYTSIDYGTTETDPDTINLAAPLAAAALADDRVGRLAGGEPVTEWLLHVSFGDGHPAEIPIPYGQRAMWSTADVSTPIPVFVSADLERLVEVPNRPPSIDQAAVETPFITLYQASDVSWIDNAFYATMSAWTVGDQSEGAFTYDPLTGGLTILEPGLYLFGVVVTWAGNTSGRRYVQLVTSNGGTLQSIPGTPPDSANFTQQIMVLGYRAAAGEVVSVEAHQTSGANLAIKGTVDGRVTNWRVVRVQA